MKTVPGGHDKGKAWSEITDNALDYWANKATSETAKAAAQAEVARRAAGGTVSVPEQTELRRQAPPPQAAMVKAEPPKSLGVAMRDPDAVNEQLTKLAESYHLVSPVTRYDNIPEGFAVSFSLVQINPDDKAGEVYKVDGGKLALSHHALNRIAAAAEVSWDPDRSRRLDDGSDSCYCHYRAVGTVRTSDGTPRTISGEVEIDVRPGSPDVVAADERAKEKGVPDRQIAQTRRFILRHAESKAKNRAIACMGVKRSYTADELRKPFAVTRLQFTGHSDDPELRREFARIRAEQIMGASRALYGGSTKALPAHEPPPLEYTVTDDGEVIEGDRY